MGEYAATSNGEERIRLVIFGEFNGLFDPAIWISEFHQLLYGRLKDPRTILRLDPGLRIDGEFYAFSAQALYDLAHSVQLRDITVYYDADPFSTYVFEVHTHFLRATRSEADTRRGHLKGILPSSRGIDRGGERAPGLVKNASSRTMIVSRAGVARATGRMGVLDCPQQVCRFSGCTFRKPDVQRQSHDTGNFIETEQKIELGIFNSLHSYRQSEMNEIRPT